MKPISPVRFSPIVMVVLVTSFLITACSTVWEKNVSMRNFNHPIHCTEEGLSAPQAISMDFNPQIDALITNHRLFLAGVDSTFLQSLDDRFNDKLAKCNVRVSNESGQRFSIEVNHILFREEIVSIYDPNSDSDPASFENRVVIVIRGRISDNHKRVSESIDIKTDHQTETDSTTFFNLRTLNTQPEETKVSNTFELGIIEENSIQMFANQCSQFIKNQVGHE